MVFKPFRVGITQDFLKPDGTLGFGDIGLDVLAEDSRIRYEFLPDVGVELPASVANQFDALLVLAPKVTETTLAGSQRLSLIARFGVGYDNIDVSACTRNNVVLTITPSGVRRPVAVSALALLLALSHKLLAKDQLTRNGRWSQKLDHMGVGLTGRTLGLIGVGNIGREILRVVAPLEMRLVAFDPFLSGDAARANGVEPLSLEALLKQSDFVCICCALTPDTHHLLNGERLTWMKPTAFLITWPAARLSISVRSRRCCLSGGLPERRWMCSSRNQSTATIHSSRSTTSFFRPTRSVGLTSYFAATDERLVGASWMSPPGVSRRMSSIVMF